MKRIVGIVSLVVVLVLVACDKPKHTSTDARPDYEKSQPQLVPSDEAPKKKPPKTAKVEDKEGVLSGKEYYDRIEKEAKIAQERLRELERIQKLSPFEKAVAPMGHETFAVAFIVRADPDKKLSVGRVLYGRVPSDHEAYMMFVRPSTSYLVGAIMPKSGYTIDDDRREERFCYPLTKDEKFTNDKRLSKSYSIEKIEQLLKK